jgi:hypothetical protein
METLYIIDPNKFEGQIISTMTSESNSPVFVDYTDGLTFEQYKQQKQNPDLIALNWDDFETLYYRPYLNTLCMPFGLTTEEIYWDGLECLPPMRWTKNKDTDEEFFFVGECYTADLYRCFVRKGEQYYTALRSKYTPAEDLFALKSL